MPNRVIAKYTSLRRHVALEGEHPDVIVADVMNSPRPTARVIVVANEKGGVGKSMIALHLCVALADANLKVAAIDLDRRQQTLSNTLSNRDVTAARLGISLPRPRHSVLQIQSGATLCDEINRVGNESDIVVIDAAGHDSAIVRRAIALADTLVTPVNSSFVDLDLLGKFHPITLDLTAQGCFAIAVEEIRRARVRKGLPGLDWMVVQNRTRRGMSQNQGRVETALQKLSRQLGFRLNRGLAERVAYRELFLLGLTHLDLRRLPDFRRTRLDAHREILALVSDLGVFPTGTEIPHVASANGQADALTEAIDSVAANNGA